MASLLHPSDEMRMAAERLLESTACLNATGPVYDCDCELAEGYAKLLNQLADDWDGDPTQHSYDDCEDVYRAALDAARAINALPTETGK